MLVRYRFDPARSRFTVQAFATGMLSAFAHSPTFAVRDFRGEFRFDTGGPLPEHLAIDLAIPAGAVELQDRVSQTDRREIHDRMRTEVLAHSAYPEIQYRAADVPCEPLGRGRYRLRIDGNLSLRGATCRQPVDAELEIFEDGVRLGGGCSLPLSRYGIKPVTALGGTIRLKDEVTLSFALVAWPEGS
jgi:polyisoprenoid-binding protein YceI